MSTRVFYELLSRPGSEMIFVQEGGVNLNDLMNAGPGGIVRCKGNPHDVVRFHDSTIPMREIQEVIVHLAQNCVGEFETSLNGKVLIIDFADDRDPVAMKLKFGGPRFKSEVLA